MGLTCSCGFDPEPGMICWESPCNYTRLKTKRSRRCCSCGEKIRPGEICGEVWRYKVPETEIECRIYGEDGEVPRASKWLCERCTDIAFSLEELGFCPAPWENQVELAKEYARDYDGKSA